MPSIFTPVRVAIWPSATVLTGWGLDDRGPRNDVGGDLEVRSELKFLMRLHARSRTSGGQTMGEYAMVMGGIALVAYAAYNLLGTDISTAVNNIASSI